MDLIGERTLRHLLEERVALGPDREFLVFEDRDGRVETWTYRQFDARVNQVANGLAAEGVRADEKIAVHLPNSPAFLLTWFAAAKLGAVLVPSNTANTVPELQYLLSFSDATTIVTETPYLPPVQQAVGDCPGVRRVLVARTAEPPPGTGRWDDLWRGQPETLEPVPLDSEATVELIFTSGTTSRPKAVMITHANCLWSGERDARHFRLGPGERNLTALPCFHVNAQSYTVLSTLTAGGTVVVLESYSARRFWRQVRRHRADVISLVAPMLRTLLAQPARATDRQHRVRTVIFGLNCTDREREEFEARFAVSLLKGYGLTEAMTCVTRAPIGGPRRWPSLGLPAVDREVRVVDDAGRDVKRGEVGEVIVKGVPGRTLMKGYYKDPDETGRAMRDGWLWTGDTAWMDDLGYLYFFERKKDVIKVGGENVSAGEVEQTLAEHPDVRECAVIGVADAIKDEAVKAFVVVRPGARLAAEDLQAHCATRLARFKVPKVVEFRESLPKTSIGKIEKKLLRERG